MIDVFNDDLITLDEVAKKFQVTPTTVGNWHRLGARGKRLEVVNLGKDVRTTKRAVNEFMRDDDHSDQSPASTNSTLPPTAEARRAHEAAVEGLRTKHKMGTESNGKAKTKNAKSA